MGQSRYYKKRNKKIIQDYRELHKNKSRNQETIDIEFALAKKYGVSTNRIHEILKRERNPGIYKELKENKERNSDEIPLKLELWQILGTRHTMHIPMDAGIYFLISQGEIVYIGESANIFRRIATHSDDKIFDSVTWQPLPNLKKSLRRKLEREYIKQYKPKYNMLSKERIIYGFNRKK
jgi:hypothetical protein